MTLPNFATTRLDGQSRMFSLNMTWTDLAASIFANGDGSTIVQMCFTAGQAQALIQISLKILSLRETNLKKRTAVYLTTSWSGSSVNLEASGRESSLIS